jgi:sulfatase modifying factor 1
MKVLLKPWGLLALITCIFVVWWSAFFESSDLPLDLEQDRREITFYGRRPVPVTAQPEQSKLESKSEPKTLAPDNLDVLIRFPRNDFATNGRPSGMVFIDGGEFELGASTQKIVALIEETSQRALASETPLHSVVLAPYYLMSTEVTNEQYLAFVQATGSKPPQNWGQQAVEAAELTHSESLADWARDHDEPAIPITPFGSAKWWDKNWRDSAWSMPPELASKPVVYINHSQARAYASWAGYRLMSEQEFVVAGRGGTQNDYPWGPKFEPGRANTIEAGLGAPVDVGEFLTGASHFDLRGAFVESGLTHDPNQVLEIHDLSGNVWEWTRSPFVAHPGFRPLKVTLNSGKDTVGPDWDRMEVVAVGGSYQMPDLATRLTVRRGTERDQATSAIGMRCSLGINQGDTLVQNLLGRVGHLIRGGPGIDFNKTLGIVQRTFDRGTGGPQGYARITQANHIYFAPYATGRGSLAALQTAALGQGIEVGLLSTTVPILLPELPAGEYRVFWSVAAVPERSDTQERLPLTATKGKLELRDFWDDEVSAVIELPAAMTRQLNEPPTITSRGFTASQTEGAPCELLVLNCALPVLGTLYSTFTFDLPLVFAEDVDFASWGK